MNKTTLLVVLLLCALIGPYRSQAFGGDVTLSVSVTTTLKPQRGDNASSGLADVKTVVTNNGTEPAVNLSLQARLFDNKRTVFAAAAVAPGKSAEVAFTIPVPASLKGSYPLFLTLFYKHPNGQAASTAFVAELRSTAAAYTPPFTLSLEQGAQAGLKTLTVHIEAKEPAITEVNLTCFTSEDLTVEPAGRRLRLENGKAATTFDIADKKGTQGRYAVYLAAETDLHGDHALTTIATVVPFIQSKPFLARMDRRIWQWIAGGAMILTILAGLFCIRRQRPGNLAETAAKRVNVVVDAVILITSILFILLNLEPHNLVTQTTTTGGDTASHYYTLDYLLHVLLPAGRISGWAMGNYAGFPLLQFYFPLPFLIMCLLHVALPLQVAFKIVSILGTLLLPLCAYFMLRAMRRPFPAPILGAIFTLPFLFNSGNSMWGGNILSSLAGEISYSLSFSLSLVLLGTLYYGARNKRWLIGNALLVFLVGFSHGYTLLFVEFMSLFFLITDEGFGGRLVYLGKVYILGFLFLAFWLVPLLSFSRFTTSYHLAWIINSWREVLPPQVLPFAILAGAGSILMLGWSLIRRRDKELPTAVAYLSAGLAVAGFFFVAAPRLGVVDIRFIPYGQVMVSLLAALFIGWSSQFLPARAPIWTLPILVLLGILLWVGGNLGPVPGWAKWNYEGFEAKPAWPLFSEINAALKGGFSDPRVMFEHADEHNAFGSSRAFESLPLFAGRATLEGVYMQASPTAPFVFYLQSEVSAVKSAPFPQYPCTTLDFVRALPHLCLFNVGDLILKSGSAKQAIRKVAGYRLKKSIGDYELWEVTANRGRYVEPLAFEPVLFPADHWKTVSYRWYVNEKQLAVHPVFANNSGQQGQPFKVRGNDPAALPAIPIDTTNCRIKETVGNDEIRIDTNWIGKPLLVKVSYHPDWQVEGADRIYLASPSFMLIYPTRSTVRLHYGRGWPDRAGAILSILGLLILALNLPLIGPERATAWHLAAVRLHLPPSLLPGLPVAIPPCLARRILVTVVFCAALGLAWFCRHIYANDPDRIFNRGIHLKDSARYGEARAAFSRVAAADPFSSMAQDSAYYVAICYYLEKRDHETIAAFGKLISDYPRSVWVPEAYYHIGLCQFRLGQKEAGTATMNKLVSDYQATEWARNAAARLAEHAGAGAAPESADQQFLRGIALFNKDQLPAARSEFEQYIRRRPASPEIPQALACLALIAYKQGDCSNTIRRYRELLARFPRSPLVPEAYYHIGICAERLGQRQDALDALRKAATGYPATVYGRQASDRLKGLHAP